MSEREDKTSWKIASQGVMHTQHTLSIKRAFKRSMRLSLAASCWLIAATCYGEVCTTQSQMKPSDRDAISNAARMFAEEVQTNNLPGLRQQSVPELTKDFTAMTALVASTSSKIASAPLAVEQVYLLDATNLKTLANGTNQDAQFFCSLNNSIAEATFLIPALPPGRYAFAQVIAQSGTQSAKSPVGLSFLLRQDTSSIWTLAGLYPKSLTAAGHDGLWYWTQAREQVKAKRLWNGYLFYREAQTLLQPAGFVGSTHFEKLQKEAVSAAPPALSEGIGNETPLVIKGQGGAEFHVTGLSTDDSLGGDKLYVVIHLAPESGPELLSGGAVLAPKPPGKLPIVVAPKDRNANAMTALLAAYPELRSSFGGVWVFAEASGKSPFVTEQAMASIP